MEWGKKWVHRWRTGCGFGSNKPKSFAVDLRWVCLCGFQQNLACQIDMQTQVTSNLVGIYPDRAARWVRGENCNILQFFEPVKFWVLGTGGFHVCLGHSHLGLQKRTCVYPLLLLVSYCVLHWINQHGLLFYPNYVDWKAADPFIYQAKTWKHGHNQIWQSIVPVSLYSSFTLVPDSNTVGPKGSNNDFISLVDSDINNPCVRQVNKTFADQLKGI
ncbi:LOW QUALITY PROTEIN: hypothetical protein NC653_011007 [Populus alba x Populus x berolinensis]|uniref:Uncharacterized protein n=1 Tax=Populus alba x Populus x berolinensis TaxID=444605 RepID=A0AAD6R167_9ROSI|nr:LOW QUALITY PROTEIN: hypothetical protein NC653_011007 [Populus alba x Populus x berolinensis]